MKSIWNRNTNLLLFTYRGLIILLIILGLSIIGGSFYGIFLQKNFSGNLLEVVLQKDGEGQTPKIIIFTGIGSLRIPTSDPSPGMVMIFVSFEHYPDDKAFSEELALRVRDFRQIIKDYVGSFSVSELQILEEDNLKSELLCRFNAILRLGQIEALYLTDFLVME